MGNSKIFAKTIEQEAYNQIIKLTENLPYKGMKIRIMPDVHAGKGSTIGTTIKLEKKMISPNTVSVDLGCGVLSVKIQGDINFEKLDNVIREHIPAGFSIRKEPLINFDKINNLICKDNVNLERGLLSLGTLGGGNHFIELDYDRENDEYWLTVHSGSRNLGLQIANYYQKKAKEYCQKNSIKVPKSLEFIVDEDFDNYIHDTKIMNEYAHLNRLLMVETIAKYMNWKILDIIESVHNYLDTDNMIIRKGAISAYKDEKVIIPLNMKDGIIIGIGLGNEDWNYSAPHGAGRVLSRKKAKELIDLQEVKDLMRGIYTTSLNEKTLDEAPQAYKNADEIIEMIDNQTIKVISRMYPVYNFKAD